MNTNEFQYIIIGNSAGGIAAAEAIRERDRESRLAIISDEPYTTYSRPLISQYLAAPCPMVEISFRHPEFYAENNIDVFLGQKVTGMDMENKNVTLAGGGVLKWQSLLIATGGMPVMPDMPGTGLRGVFTFNKLDEAKAIDAFLQSRHLAKAIIVGGGLIGLSVTEALQRRCIAVTIIEMQDRILSTMLDTKGSAIETTALEEAGVEILTGCTVVKINGGQEQEVTGVTLTDGTIIHADMVIFAIGVKPRLELVKDSGMAINRGILVNRHMETSIAGVYACGDVAEAYDFVLGENRLTPVWPNAFEGGRVAGLNMAGGNEEYAGGTALNAMKYFGRHIVSAGIVNPGDSDETLAANYGESYRKVVLNHGRVIGFIFAGDIQKAGIIYGLMKDRANVSAYKQALVSDNFGLASLPRKIWQKRLAQPSMRDASIITVPEEMEEATIGD